jgi:hypothetical protein
MSADDTDPETPSETSPLLELKGTEQLLPPGGHEAYVARTSAIADERMVGARAPATPEALGDFVLDGVKYYGAKMMFPKTFQPKDRALIGWHFKRMRYTRPGSERGRRL